MTVEKWAEDFKGYINELELFHDDHNGIMEFIDEGANMLKEQEPKYVNDIAQQIGCFSGTCPKCGKMLNTTCNKNFCGECGQAVKWE